MIWQRERGAVGRVPSSDDDVIVFEAFLVESLQLYFLFFVHTCL